MSFIDGEITDSRRFIDMEPAIPPSENPFDKAIDYAESQEVEVGKQQAGVELSKALCDHEVEHSD